MYRCKAKLKAEGSWGPPDLLYDLILQRYAPWKFGGQKLKGAENSARLLEDDVFVRHILLDQIASREPKPYLTAEEVQQIIDWKVFHGRFHAALLKDVENLKDSVASRITSEAFALLKEKNMEEAIKTLCEMRGIGVIGASAILSFAYPRLCAYMAEELFDALLGVKDIRGEKNQIEACKELAATCAAFAAELNRHNNSSGSATSSSSSSASSSGRPWTAADVGRAVWARIYAGRLGSELEKGDKCGIKSEGGKREAPPEHDGAEDPPNDKEGDCGGSSSSSSSSGSHAAAAPRASPPPPSDRAEQHHQQGDEEQEPEELDEIALMFREYSKPKAKPAAVAVAAPAPGTTAPEVGSKRKQPSADKPGEGEDEDKGGGGASGGGGRGSSGKRAK
jgi:hypothetical protein